MQSFRLGDLDGFFITSYDNGLQLLGSHHRSQSPRTAGIVICKHDGCGDLIFAGRTDSRNFYRLAQFIFECLPGFNGSFAP